LAPRWIVIRLLMLLGLASNVVTPAPTLKAKTNSPGRQLVPSGIAVRRE